MTPALALLLLLAPAPAPVAEVPNLVLPDRARSKKLQVRVTYPREAGSCPVILFSHGLFGSKDGYRPLASFWAAHGYVCLQPSHEDSRSLGKKTVFRAQRAWSSRPKDLSFLIDSLDAIRKALPGWKGRFDKERIGVGGHSFGAHTAMLVGGARAYPLGALRKGRSFRDPRVRCVLLISPQGRGGLFREDSWRTMKLPALVITGSEDRSPLDRSKRPDWRLDPFRLAPPADKYLLWIEGAHHGFGGISGVRWRGAGPRDPRQVQLVREVSLDFFDAYLRGDAQARRRLERGARVRASKLEARLEIRHPAAPAR